MSLQFHQIHSNSESQNVSFHEIMELQSFKFGLNDIIPVNVQNISPLAFLAFNKLLSCKSFIHANEYA